MSNTTYIEEVLKELEKYWIRNIGSVREEDGSITPSPLSAYAKTQTFLKSKLTQAIRDTEVKTAEELRMTELNISKSWNDRDLRIRTYSIEETAEEYGFNQAVKEINTKIDKIINTNQKD